MIKDQDDIVEFLVEHDYEVTIEPDAVVAHYTKMNGERAQERFTNFDDAIDFALAE
jgi:hypothetical protein